MARTREEQSSSSISLPDINGHKPSDMKSTQAGFSVHKNFNYFKLPTKAPLDPKIKYIKDLLAQKPWLSNMNLSDFPL